MTRMLATMLAAMLNGLLCLGAIASCLLSTPARAQVRVEIVPPSFIVTNRPVYHDGRATYWYRNRWYYRDGRDWRYYHDEPAPLREHRRRREPVFQYYGRPHGDRDRRHHR